MSTALNIGTLPQGFCPATWQAALNGIGGALTVDIPSASGFTISVTKPSSTGNVWFRIDSLGRFLGIYIFGQGSWLSAHPLASGLTQWWFAALPNFATFDGGDSSSVGPASGAMWQQAKDSNGTLIAATFLIPAGTLPSSTVLSLGGTGGEETHKLITAELASHSHYVANSDSTGASGATDLAANQTVMSHYSGVGANAYIFQGTSTPSTLGISSLTGSDTAHNNMPPYVVGYLLQRTARIFYSVS
jgi:hypothetical protein